MSDNKSRFCLAEVVAVFFFFWVRAAGIATVAAGTTAASFSFFLLFIGTGGGAKGFLKVFAMWDRGIATKRLAGDYQLDYGGAHVINGVLYIVSCFMTMIYFNTVIRRSPSKWGCTVITKKTRGCN
jgi:hypothetical protein